MDHPRLIETGIGNYMHDALNTCHSNRVRIYSIALNVGVLLLFIAVVCLTLYYCYRKKPTPMKLIAK